MDATLEIRVQPRAGRDEIAGERDGRVLVRVSAPPVDGKANAAACAVIARAARVRRRSVEVTRGARSRDKTVRVAGMTSAALRAALDLS